MPLLVLIAAIATALASSVVPGHVRVAYPGSMDCQQGCDVVAAGWPFLYLVDEPGLSPVGSVSLVGGLLGLDTFRLDALLETVMFWICAWAAVVWTIWRAVWSRPS